MSGDVGVERTFSPTMNYYDAGMYSMKRTLPCLALRDGHWSYGATYLYGGKFNQLNAESYCDMSSHADGGWSSVITCAK